MVLNGGLRGFPGTPKDGSTRNDQPPDDTGCEMAASCLDCPFERCLEDEPSGAFRYIKARRDATIARMVREGKGTRQIARETGVSQRTVQRAIKGTGFQYPNRKPKSTQG